MDRKTITILIWVTLAGVLFGLLVYFITSRPTEDGRAIQEIFEAQQEGKLSAKGESLKAELIAPLGGGAGVIFAASDFDVGYLPAPLDRLMIFVNQSSWQDAEESAVAWLRSRGFSDQDVCNLPTVISVAVNDPATATNIPGNHLPGFCAELLNP